MKISWPCLNLSKFVNVSLAVIACLTMTAKLQAENPVATEEAVILKYEFTQGDNLAYDIQSESRMETIKGPHSLNSTSKSNTYRDLKILKVHADGKAEVEVFVRYVRMENKYDNDPVKIFDSTDPETFSKEFDHIQKLIDKPYVKILIAPDGKLEQILEINGIAVKQEDEAESGGIKNEIKADPSMNFLITFPVEPVKVGSIWKETIEQEIPMTKTLKTKINLIRTFELTKLENGMATIQFKTAFITPIRDPAQEVKTMQMKPRGEMIFDINRGVMVSRTTQTAGTVIGAMGPDSSVSSNTIKKDTLTDKLPPSKKVVVSPESIGIYR